jgi:hypothetical protein
LSKRACWRYRRRAIRLARGSAFVGISLEDRIFLEDERSAMDRYIHEQNVAHYRKVLSETTDPTKRQTVLKLLADEQALRPTAKESWPLRY